MIHLLSRRVLCALLGLIAGAAPACAQRVNLRLGSEPSSQQCAAWTQALLTRRTAEVGWLPYCPQGPAVLSAALADAPQVDDVAYLALLAQQAADLRTPETFEAALALAANRAATIGGRTLGILVLAGHLGVAQTLGERSLPEMFTTPIGGGLCMLRLRSSEGYAVESPLSADAETRAARILESVRDDSASGIQLQRLAGCMRRGASDVPEPPDVSKIDVRYRCGDRLEVRNRSTRDVMLRYVVRDATGTVIDESNVRARAGGAWREFRTEPEVTVGRLQLLYNGTLVSSVEMTGTSCARS